ncbi:hypothetical protein KY343_06890 [Candidatus Woesearchaeota archaeon]|nr:hypothetical protein [Candidatus Woesearchaeota archaeon]
MGLEDQLKVKPEIKINQERCVYYEECKGFCNGYRNCEDYTTKEEHDLINKRKK